MFSGLILETVPVCVELRFGLAIMLVKGTSDHRPAGPIPWYAHRQKPCPSLDLRACPGDLKGCERLSALALGHRAGYHPNEKHLTHKGTVERIVDPLSLGFVREDSSGLLFGFLFDAIDNYRGEPLSEIGLELGAVVHFDEVDGRITRLRAATSSSSLAMSAAIH